MLHHPKPSPRPSQQPFLPSQHVSVTFSFFLQVSTYLCWGLGSRCTHERFQLLVQVVRALRDLFRLPPRASSSHTSHSTPDSSSSTSRTPSYGCRTTSAFSRSRVDDRVRTISLTLVLDGRLGKSSSERPGFRRNGRGRSVVELDRQVLTYSSSDQFLRARGRGQERVRGLTFGESSIKGSLGACSVRSVRVREESTSHTPPRLVVLRPAPLSSMINSSSSPT